MSFISFLFITSVGDPPQPMFFENVYDLPINRTLCILIVKCFRVIYFIL